MNEITIRIGGESGEGTISGGDIIALGAARWGYHVYTFRTFPAEILGGPCMFQVRIGDQPIAILILEIQIAGRRMKSETRRIAEATGDSGKISRGDASPAEWVEHHVALA